MIEGPESAGANPERNVLSGAPARLFQKGDENACTRIGRSIDRDDVGFLADNIQSEDQRLSGKSIPKVPDESNKQAVL